MEQLTDENNGSGLSIFEILPGRTLGSPPRGQKSPRPPIAHVSQIAQSAPGRMPDILNVCKSLEITTEIVTPSNVSFP